MSQVSDVILYFSNDITLLNNYYSESEEVRHRFADELRRGFLEKTDENREQHEQIFDPGSIHIFVYELGDSAVILCSRSRVLNENYWPTRFRILEDVYSNFKKAGIEFAYPHMDVHIDS